MTDEIESKPPEAPAGRPSATQRWIALFFLSIPMFGNYYIYDSINPLGDLFVQKLQFSDQTIGWLNSIYSVSSMLTLVIGGILIDRFGTRRAIVLFSILCLAGAALTAFGGGPAMLCGRGVLGLGAESLVVAITTAMAKWFKGKELSFAFAINLTIARFGSVAADNSPGWGRFAFYPDGPGTEPSWRGPLILAIGAGIICLLGAVGYHLLERRGDARRLLGEKGAVDRLNLRETFRFSPSYWYIVGLCITFYSAIFPFRTFAVKFFMHTHFADLAPEAAREAAGSFNGILPLAAMVATPLFGLLADRIGRRGLLMLVGSLLLMPVYLLMAYSHASLWIPMAFMGTAFSLIPAVMWPTVAYIVDEKRLGTAYALMTLIQQIGFFALNLLIGWANDTWKADASNPAGYIPGMWIFTSLGFAGVFFAILLWRSEGRSGSQKRSAVPSPA